MSLQWLVLILVAALLLGAALLGARAFARTLGDDPDRAPPWLVLSPILYVFRRWLYRHR